MVGDIHPMTLFAWRFPAVRFGLFNNAWAVCVCVVGNGLVASLMVTSPRLLK